jgi:peptidoglycan/LPS O-acetylase OafA/YrhL
MALSVRIFIFLIGIFLFLMIFELVRRRKFREELSILWLLIGITVIFSSFADRIIDPLSHKLGFGYPPALVFVVISFLLVLALLYFSIVVSDLKGKNKELSQKIALMEYKLGKLYQKTE